MLLLASAVGASMSGAIYAGVEVETGLTSAPESIAPIAPENSVSTAPERPVFVVAGSESEPEFIEATVPLREEDLRLPVPHAFLEEIEADLAGAELVFNDGMRIGAMEFVEPSEDVVVRRPRRRAAPRPPVPRLHSNPGMHVVLTARRMMARNEAIQGSCYRYLSEVYARAGHSGWRNRTIVYRAEREGPYANQDLIRPGDWLYIVNDPHRTPVGTHSVMFVGWRDRARGYANVISHPGWGAPHTGREGTYDVSQTYRIIRPILRR